MTYTHRSFFEFLPNVLERFNLHAPIKWIKKIYPILIVLGILLSTLHQSSLGSLYLIMPSKLHPSGAPGTTLPFLRIGNNVCRFGHDDLRIHAKKSARAFGRALETSVLVELGGALLVALWVDALLRFEDYFHRGMLRQVIQPSYRSLLPLARELLLAFVIPITMLELQERVDVARTALSSFGVHRARLHHQSTEYRSHRFRNLRRTSLFTKMDRVLRDIS